MRQKAKSGGPGSEMVPAGRSGQTGVGGVDGVVDDPTFLAAAEALAGYEFVRDLTLLEGQGVKGFFLGPGATAEFADEKTGEIRTVPTILLQVKNVRYRLVCPAMLERLVGAIEIGSEVAIVRGGYRNTRKGHRITEYALGVKK